jgi:hypothetical protein
MLVLVIHFRKQHGINRKKRREELSGGQVNLNAINLGLDL